MVAQQRYAAFNLATGLAALTLFAALIPIVGVAKAQSGFALLAISALGPLFFRRRKGQITSDERDRAILLRSIQIVFVVFWLLLVASLMVAYYALRHRGAIPIDVLPLVVWLATAILLITHSAILLFLYQRS
jgi:hypothetical protein